MSRTIIKRSAAILGTTVATGALLLGSTGLAQAATYSNGNGQSDRSAVDGTGNAQASANATDAGRLRVDTEADGGNAAGGALGGTTSQQTKGTATASLTKRVSVADGTYKVVITYKDLKGFESDRGSNADARAVRRSTVRFDSQAGGGDRQIRRVQEVPSGTGNRSTVIFFNVPANASGRFAITGELKAVSTATGANNSSDANANASDVSFKVNRVS